MAADEPPPILRPIPRRTFEITPASSSSQSSRPPSPPSATEASPKGTHLAPPSGRSTTITNDTSPSRTRSILNLTSSTLLGIYSPTGYNSGENKDEPSTPWGTGALTPNRRPGGGVGGDESLPTSPRLALLNWEKYPSLGLGGDSQQQNQQQQGRRPPSSSGGHQHLGFVNFFIPLVVRTVLLFGFGIAYGIIITHLHDDSRLAPVRVEGLDRYDWRYLVFWGVAGIGLGSLLPWVDLLWENGGNGWQQVDTSSPQSAPRQGDIIKEKASGSQTGASTDANSLSADWTPVVRSIGAFVGIAFAIVRLRLHLHTP